QRAFSWQQHLPRSRNEEPFERGIHDKSIDQRYPAKELTLQCLDVEGVVESDFGGLSQVTQETNIVLCIPFKAVGGVERRLEQRPSTRSGLDALKDQCNCRDRCLAFL